MAMSLTFDCFEDFFEEFSDCLEEISNNETPNDEKSDKYIDNAFSRPVFYSSVSDKATLSTRTCDPQKELTFNDEIFAVTHNKYNANFILSVILEWDVEWLNERNDFKVTNHLIPFNERISLKEKVLNKTCYDCLEEYQSAYIPLILFETWAQISNDFNNTKHFDFEVMTAPDIGLKDSFNTFRTLTLHTLVAEKDIEKYPSNGDLLILEIKTDNGPSNKIFFGYVIKFYCEEIIPSTKLLLSLSEEQTYLKTHLLKYVVALGKRFNRITGISFGQRINAKAFHHLKPTMRQIALLSNLNTSPLCKDILTPKSFTCQVVVPNKISLSCHNFNESQSKAIFSISEALKCPYAVPKLVLVQGPPGTGKTFTLIETLKHIYMSWESDKGLPHILICAPSNGAVNEISRRLYKEKDFLVKHKVEKYRRELRCVRVGNESKIKGEDRSLLLEQLVKDIVNEFKELKGKIEKKIKKLDEEVGEHIFHSDLPLQRNILVAELNKLKTSERQLKIESTDRIRMDIMKSADIVLSTLNSSHSFPIEYLFLNYGINTFDCVIVDEASQCSEPELLMPLVYKMSKIILIGDPKQLPATVISKKASSLNLGRSLFERFYNHFDLCEQNNPNEKSPVLMLTEQYRMHPQICQFPSSQFYGGKLVTSSEVMKNLDFNLLKPYILFDVNDTIESSHPTNKSILNLKEANFVIRLATLIDQMLNRSEVNQNKYSVGVITPYNGQKNHLNNDFKNKRFNNIVVDINTVDGFQGQERDIIIFSAVRAFDEKNRRKSIGFLDSVQRMNVALTRAKYSMILCISGRSLQIDKNWKSLIDDSIRRKNIRFKVTTTSNPKDVKKMLAPDAFDYVSETELWPQLY